MRLQINGVVLIGTSVRLEYDRHHWDFFHGGGPNVLLVTPASILAFLKAGNVDLKAIKEPEHAQLVVACIEEAKPNIVEHFARHVLSKHDGIDAVSDRAENHFRMIQSAVERRLSPVVA